MSTFTATGFDHAIAERLERIKANPNPRSWKGRILRVIRWHQALDRACAWEAYKLTFTVVGTVGFISYLLWAHTAMAVLGLGLMYATWLGVYCQCEK
jgi:hypothetical protein